MTTCDEPQPNMALMLYLFVEELAWYALQLMLPTAPRPVRTEPPTAESIIQPLEAVKRLLL